MKSTKEFVAMIGAAAALCSPLPAAALENFWSVCGHVDVDIVGDSVYRVTNCDIPRTSWSDAEVLIGPALNVAQVELRGDIAKGRVQFFARAQNGWNEIEHRWDPATAAGSVLLEEVLTFTVAPGSYPDGAYAYADGSASGVYSKLNPAELQVHYDVAFGEVHSFDISLGPADPGGGWTKDETFTLTRRLVAPGAILLAPFVVQVPVYARFETSGAGAWTGQPYEALGVVDFWHAYDWNESVGFTAIRVPEGVTWTSASGVFLTQAIPEPSPAWLMGVALGVLILWRHKRRDAGEAGA